MATPSERRWKMRDLRTAQPDQVYQMPGLFGSPSRLQQEVQPTIQNRFLMIAEHITDIELELIAFLGTDFGASVSAEIGQEAVADIFMAGSRARQSLDAQEIAAVLTELMQKEAA